MPNVAALVTLVLTGSSWQRRLLEQGWIPEPTAEQVRWFTIVDWVGLGVISVIGLLWLLLLVRRSRPARADVRAYRLAIR